LSANGAGQKFEVDAKPILLAVILVVVGWFLAALGASLSGRHVVTQVARGVTGMETPPQVLAKARWGQAKAAAVAGAGAWRGSKD
jgi:hypothetical protein